MRSTESGAAKANAAVFTQLLVNTVVSGVVTSFLWFALTFWVYLETRSVLTTSVIGAAFSLFSAMFAVPFGTFVDRHRRRTSMILSSTLSLAGYTIGAFIYAVVGEDALLELTNPMLWVLMVVMLAASVTGNLRAITMATCVSLLVPLEAQDKANGRVGMAQGLSFVVSSVFSGLVIGRLGMGWAIGITIALTAATLFHLVLIDIVGDTAAPEATGSRTADFSGAWTAIQAVPGLVWLVAFASFNNVLFGVFMSLMDAYGLSLVSVEAWGFLWGGLSLLLLVGGLLVATRGVGARPLHTILMVNAAGWIMCSLFTARSSIVLFAIGMATWMLLGPVAEAAEQTVLQRTVPFEQQGRVFGFAQMVENGAAPVTSLMIGPIAQFGAIPWMTDGRGADTIGGWFGTGPDRGIALVFTVAGLLGVIATFGAARSAWFAAIARADAEAVALACVGADAGRHH